MALRLCAFQGNQGQGTTMGKTAPRTYCPIDAELVEQFSEAVTNYFGAVSDLSAITAGTRSGGSLFYKAYRTARREHENCERARKALERHRSEHQCQR